MGLHPSLDLFGTKGHKRSKIKTTLSEHFLKDKKGIEDKDAQCYCCPLTVYSDNPITYFAVSYREAGVETSVETSVNLVALNPKIVHVIRSPGVRAFDVGVHASLKDIDDFLATYKEGQLSIDAYQLVDEFTKYLSKKGGVEANSTDVM